MANATETARKYDKMQDALADYASEDRIGAEGYCAEGYQLGEEAFALLPAIQTSAFIEEALEDFPASARYLIAVSADYRLAELVKAEAPADVRRAA